MRYRYHLCHLVFVHPTGGIIVPISQPRRVSYPRPFPARISIKAPPMQMPGIRSNIQLHFLPVMSIPMLPRKCQTTRSAVPVYRCGVSLLYIKQLYTLPSVSRCQPPKSCLTLSILFICKRASIRYTSVRLSSKRPRQGLGRTFSLSSSYA